MLDDMSKANAKEQVRVQEDAFDAGSELNAFLKDSAGAGGISTFIGVVRGKSQIGNLQSMTLDHYPGMTERELEKIVEEAKTRWQLIRCKIIHRYGRLVPGENIVFVATAAEHRKESIESCEFLIDILKTRATFWKLEESDSAALWVEAKEEKIG